MLEHLKNYFHLTSSEYRASLVMTGIVFALVLGLPFVHLLVPDNLDETARLSRWADSLFEAGCFRPDSLTAEPAGDKGSYSAASFENGPFHFDPNALDKEGWMLTGLEERVVRTIMNYREKGGRFRKPEDLEKIYGLSQQDFQRLKPWLKFEPVSKSDAGHKPKVSQADISQSNQAAPAGSLELNSADTAQLMECRGIGKVIAARIIKYRDLLGGFYSTEQLREVWGLDSSRFGLIAVQVYADPAGIRKMDINTISFKELLKHPYFEYHLVKAIFMLRDERGSIDSIGQLKEIPFMYAELFEKVSPYLTVNDITGK